MKRIAAAAILFSGVVPASLAAGDDVRLTAREIMLAIIIPSSDALWAVGMEEDTPKPDEYWTTLEHHALRLITAGVALDAIGHDGIGGDADKAKKWRGYNADMIAISQSALEAARAKNYEGVLDAGNYLLDPCMACHQDFMPQPQ